MFAQDDDGVTRLIARNRDRKAAREVFHHVPLSVVKLEDRRMLTGREPQCPEAEILRKIIPGSRVSLGRGGGGSDFAKNTDYSERNRGVLSVVVFLRSG